MWETICPQCGALYPSVQFLGVFLAIACLALVLAIFAVISYGGRNVLDYLVLLAQAVLVGALTLNIVVLQKRRKGV